MTGPELGTGKHKKVSWFQEKCGQRIFAGLLQQQCTGCTLNGHASSTGPVHWQVCEMYVHNGGLEAMGCYDVEFAADCVQGARNEIFALQPAPVQTSYMGFPATMGASFLPYLITDKVVAPDSCRHCYSENLALMPNCYFVNDYKHAHMVRPSSQLMQSLGWLKLQLMRMGQCSLHCLLLTG